MEARLKIGFDATPIREGRSGVGVYTENLVRALTHLTSAPELHLLTNDLSLRSSDAPTGTQTRWHEHPAPWRALWMQAVLPRALREVDVDVCHYPNFLTPVVPSCPSVVTFHDMALFRYPQLFTPKKRYLSRSLIPSVARTADAIIAVSEFTRREIMDLLGVPRERIHVIYEAADPTFGPPPDEAKEAVRRQYGLPDRFVLCAGTIEPRKNLPRLVNAFSEISERPGLRDCVLVLVGGLGWKTQETLEALAPLENRGRALRLGYVPRDHLPALYSLADCVAYPSLYEGFGLPVVEAMACGAAVLTSHNSAMEEVVGDAACLVEPRREASIAMGLERVLQSRDYTGELSARGLEVAAQYSWDRAAEETHNLYRKVAHGRATARPPKGPVDPAQLRTKIQRAVAYADVFDFPLTPRELSHSLEGVRVSEGEITEALQTDATLRKTVETAQGFVFLAGRKELIAHRHSQAERTDALLGRHQVILSVIRRLPFVRMVALSGGSAFKNSPSDEDIDLFLVTEEDRAWFAFAMVVVAARLAGQREIICANYLVDMSNLALPNAGDFFTGHQLIHLKPLSGARIYRRLRRANAWALDMFPGADIDPETQTTEMSPVSFLAQRTAEWALRPIGRLGNAVARKIFGARIRKKAERAPGSAVVLEPGVLKLHITDHRWPASERYSNRLESLRTSSGTKAESESADARATERAT